MNVKEIQVSGLVHRTNKYTAQNGMALVATVLRKLGRATHGLSFSREPNPDHVKIYEKCIQEEYAEFMSANTDSNKLKELLDLIWVCIMYGLAHGWNLSGALGALVEEFKSKFKNEKGEFAPTYREDGKLLKGKGFNPMDPNKYVAKWDNHD